MCNTDVCRRLPLQREIVRIQRLTGEFGWGARILTQHDLRGTHQLSYCNCRRFSFLRTRSGYDPALIAKSAFLQSTGSRKAVRFCSLSLI